MTHAYPHFQKSQLNRSEVMPTHTRIRMFNTKWLMEIDVIAVIPDDS